MNTNIDRYLLAEKAGSEGVWDWDLRSDTLYLSPRFKEFLGLPPGDANRPADWLSLVHSEDVEWLHASFEAQMVGLTVPFQIEHRVRRSGMPNDGQTEWRWLVCRGMAVMDDAGEPIRLVGSVADITDRKHAERELRRSEERYALAAAASNDGLYDWDLLTDRIYYSPRWASLLGLSAGDLGDHPLEWLDRIHPQDRCIVTDAIDRLGRSPGSEGDAAFQVEYRMHDAAGVIRWMACRGIAVLDPDGKPVRLVGSQADVTDRKTAEQRLRQSEERYALAAAGAADGLWDWHLDSGEVYYSPRWKAMLGFEEAELADTVDEWLQRVLPGDLDGLRTAINLHLSGERPHLQHEFRIRRKPGDEMWMLVRGLAVRNEAGSAVRIAGSMTDITARKKAEQQLLFDAVHDTMTGLPNRTLLLDRIGQALDRNRRAGAQPFAALIIDLDRFKSINDAFGTSIGDRVLRLVAKRLDASRRVGDTLARLSADEFGVLLDGLDDAGEALETAERMARAICRPIALEEHDLVLTASIGVALSQTGYERAEDMLRDASLAMYRAKSGGRARLDVFDANLRRQAMNAMRMEADLRAALEQGQFCLHYQPIVHLESGIIAGFEALMRWNHPDRGLVPPGEFIPLAEETGLIAPMGRWALVEAIRQLAAWQRRFPRPAPLFMSVNVSFRQFRDDDMVGLVRDLLDELPVPPSSLKLELTESVLMEKPDECRLLMQSIRDMDVRLSIDDFGTGYSSLAYLHRFPVDTLKIDRSFIRALSTGDGSAAIVQVIAGLATILRLDAVAEGVETADEAVYLRGIQCKYAQGFHFARPAPPEAVERLLVAEDERMALPTPACL
ncbi:sensor domain-containing protein [Azospirillum picis]|uniref:Diguanylate cyclase (GGDEF)-like protein/PAS domain S-box-containing protein n=1 Tax=Azospirillum picis TaxID=488438 RepID=A0ABU0MFG2_9PROT|nr:GGDEF and EAL domain-containing protein [Azospirillum picis]MBP2298770.1 diguanylate cyclase (GGDEF)-like protein/PAS domain S-box-containing protein [Azospirillum picis]MDQ0532181.1 diguanylate cyclase (GGDEF)-like protein/PAS domain S-box-containing protein [Azospirillum picis]